MLQATQKTAAPQVRRDKAMGTRSGDESVHTTGQLARMHSVCETTIRHVGDLVAPNARRAGRVRIYSDREAAMIHKELARRGLIAVGTETTETTEDSAAGGGGGGGGGVKPRPPGEDADGG